MAEHTTYVRSLTNSLTAPPRGLVSATPMAAVKTSLQIKCHFFIGIKTMQANKREALASSMNLPTQQPGISLL